MHPPERAGTAYGVPREVPARFAELDEQLSEQEWLALGVLASEPCVPESAVNALVDAGRSFIDSGLADGWLRTERVAQRPVFGQGFRAERLFTLAPELRTLTLQRLQSEQRLDAVVYAVQAERLQQHALFGRVGAREVDLGEFGILAVRVFVVRLHREVARIRRAGREPLGGIRELRLPEQQRARGRIGGEQVEERRGARARQAGQEHRAPDLARTDLGVAAQRGFGRHGQCRRLLPRASQRGACRQGH